MVQKQKMCKGKRLAALFTALVLFIGLLPTVSIALPEQTSEVFALSESDIPEPLSAEQLAQHGAVQRLRGEEPDEYTFVFLNSDGTRTSYSYGVPVKYTDENGAVRDKNNTIKDFNNEYGNLDSDVQLRFPKKLNAVKISYKNRQVQIKPVTDMAPGHINAEVSGNTVTYANAFGEGMDLRYASTMNGVKEDIILRSNTGVNSFSFEVKTGGLALKELDGEWCVADGDRKIFGFGDLDVTDSFTGEDEATDDWDAHSTTASISVRTVQENKKYVVTLSVDEAFLNAPTTVYPVYVDPSFNVESSYIQDTYISQGSPNANYGTGKDLKLGYGASSKSNRILVKFKNWVGSESRPGLDMTTIVSAKYYMYCTTTYTSMPYVDAYMVPLESAEWMDTGATWNNAAASTLNTSLLNGSTKVGSAGWYNFDVTSAYKAWWSALKSRGLLFKMRVESATENYYRHFASANYTADSKKLPYLAVQYGAQGIVISPTSANLAVGETVQLKTSIYPTSIDQQVTWTSSNPDVAEVSSSGLVTAKKTGSTTITARAVKNSAIYATCNIRVIVPVSSVELDYDEYSIKVGESFSLLTTAYPSNATYKTVAWHTENPDVVTVDSHGMVTARGVGQAKITATAQYGSGSAECTVTVHNIESITLTRLLADADDMTVRVTKLTSGEAYFQVYSNISDEQGDIYNVSSQNKIWMDGAYSYINGLSAVDRVLAVNSVEYKAWLARDKTINTINKYGWNVEIGSDEYYGMWMHWTLYEKAYAEAVHLIAQVADTALLMGMTAYQAVVTFQSIEMLVNQRKLITSSQYQSISGASNAFSNLNDLQAVTEGITDVENVSGSRRTWRASEMRVAEEFSLSDGYQYNRSYKIIDGVLTEVPYGTAGSQRPDFYNPELNKIIEVKNYNITTANGRGNLASNIAAQYNQRTNLFVGADIQFKVDVYGQSYTDEMLDDLLSRVSNLLGSSDMVKFIKN